MAKGSLSS